MMNIYEESTINFWIWHGSCFSLGRVCVKLCGCFILFRYCYKCTNFAMYFSAYSLYYFTFTQYLFSQNLNTSIYNCVSNCQEYSLKWINKTAGFVKCFLVEYLLTAISSIINKGNNKITELRTILQRERHFNFCPKTKKI
jgi:hypothetical protein